MTLFVGKPMKVGLRNRKDLVLIQEKGIYSDNIDNIDRTEITVENNIVKRITLFKLWRIAEIYEMLWQCADSRLLI